MPEYRPDADQLLNVAKSHFDIIRRAALAIGGALLAYGLARCFQANAGLASALSAAVGAAIVGFFAPGWPERRA